MNETRKNLFIAPVDMKPGDDVTLFFGRPILIERDGVEIWRDEKLFPKVIPPEFADPAVWRLTDITV